MPSADHPGEIARHDYVEERGTPEERAAFEAHLATCPACRAETAALQMLRVAIAGERERLAERDPVFEARLRSALDREDASRAESATVRAGAPRSRRRSLLLVAAAAAAMALVWLARGLVAPDLDLATRVLRDAEAAAKAPFELAYRTEDPAQLAQFHREHGIAFPTRVLDLSMMGWTLAGGDVAPLAGRPSALAMYRDAEGRWLLCRMFEGSLTDLPTAADRFEASGFEFRVHRGERVTAVFWREGGVLCVLVSELPEHEVRALAVAKAMLPG